MLPKQVLLITTELRPGGAEKCLANLACGLDKNKFRCRVVSIWSKPETKKTRLVTQLEEQGIEIDFLNCDSKLMVFSAVKKLKKIILKNEIDLVQSFLFPGNLIAGLAVSRLQKRKQSFVQLLTGIRVADPSRFRHFVERHTTKVARKIVCVSDSVKQFAETEMKLPADKLISIPNGIEIRCQNEREINRRSVPVQNVMSDFGIEKPFVLFLGRLTEQKGLVPFLKELKKFDRQVPPTDLVFMGDGPLRKAIEDQAAALKNRRCHFVGWNANPNEFIHAAETLILPSLWEGMPNVLLETMASGKPFVAFSVDGVSQLHKSAEDDPTRESLMQFVRPKDYQKFFSNLSQVLNSKELAKRIGASNLNLIAEKFSLKKMIAKYEHAYLDLLSNPEQS